MSFSQTESSPLFGVWGGFPTFGPVAARPPVGGVPGIGAVVGH